MQDSKDDTDLALLVADTQAQLDEAATILRDGGLIDIQALAPRIQTICEIAVAQKRSDMAPALLTLTQMLDTLETLLRDAVAKGTSLPDNTPRQAAKAYRTAAVSYAEDAEPVPPNDVPRR